MIDRKCNTLEGNAIIEHLLIELRRQEFLDHWNLTVVCPERDIGPKSGELIADCSDLKHHNWWVEVDAIN